MKKWLGHSEFGFLLVSDPLLPLLFMGKEG